jgi:hypothetical protein
MTIRDIIRELPAALVLIALWCAVYLLLAMLAAQP